jgi:hypothetical protein
MGGKYDIEMNRWAFAIGDPPRGPVSLLRVVPRNSLCDVVLSNLHLQPGYTYSLPTNAVIGGWQRGGGTITSKSQIEKPPKPMQGKIKNKKSSFQKNCRSLSSVAMSNHGCRIPIRVLITYRVVQTSRMHSWLASNLLAAAIRIRSRCCRWATLTYPYRSAYT